MKKKRTCLEECQWAFGFLESFQSFFKIQDKKKPFWTM